MENWKNIEGFESLYQVSDAGRVLSLRNGKPLAPYLRGKYLCVTLHRDGVRKSRAIHQLVLETFISVRPDGLVAAHLDGNRSNCTLPNLAWVTPAENEAHKVAHGTSPHGRRSTQAKLSDLQANIVREANALGLSMPKIAALAGVNTSTVHRIIQGRRYLHG